MTSEIVMPNRATEAFIGALSFNSANINTGIPLEEFMEHLAMITPQSTVRIYAGQKPNVLQIIQKEPPVDSNQRVAIVTETIESVYLRAGGKRRVYQSVRYLAAIERNCQPDQKRYVIDLSTTLSVDSIQRMIPERIRNQIEFYVGNRSTRHKKAS